MNARDAIKLAIDSGHMVATAYLDDLTDDEMMHRPHPNCNHLKWQVGHLIAAENSMMEAVAPGSMPALPNGFAERYTKETASSDDAAQFDTKEELMQQLETQRAGTLAALGQTTDEGLDQEAPEPMRQYVPTVGAVFDLQGGHWLMHAGQWAVVRRQLGRPPLF